MKKSHLALIFSATFLGGCSALLAPGYHRPVAPVPSTWPTGPAYGPSGTVPAGAMADLGWHRVILDVRLQELVEIALKNNRDLRIAALNIEKARAQYGISRANMFPPVNAVTSGTHSQSALDLSGPSSSGRVSHSYSAEIGFSSYELDVFGKVQNQLDAAKESWLQQVELHNSLQISLIAEVAAAYLSLAADQEYLRLAKATWASQQQSLRLARQRFSIGVISQIDVSQVQSSVDAASIDLAAYTTQVEQDRNALAVLLGRQIPDSLVPIDGLLDGAPIVKNIPAGLSSDVLLRRPDLRAAEHALKAANANIGAARAAFFPSITLTANTGTASDDINRLFRGGNGSWSFVPQINLPIFSGGSLMASLEAAKISRDINVATYEQGIQTAFREVADALAQYGTINDQLRAQQSLVQATQQSYRLSLLRYRSGIDSYLMVLDSQRSLYAAQKNLLGTKRSQQINLITLYKVLGGGLNP